MMIINNRRKPAKPGKTEQGVNANKAFSTPNDYLNGSLKRLSRSTTIEWWLNVDYVESESAIA